MHIYNTYFIKRKGIYIWLSKNSILEQDDEIVEIRPITEADENKVLSFQNGELIGKSFWNKNNESIIEIDEPIEEEMEEEDELGCFRDDDNIGESFDIN